MMKPPAHSTEKEIIRRFREHELSRAGIYRYDTPINNSPKEVSLPQKNNLLEVRKTYIFA